VGARWAAGRRAFSAAAHAVCLCWCAGTSPHHATSHAGTPGACQAPPGARPRAAGALLQLGGPTFMVKSFTPVEAISLPRCRKKLRVAMDSSCSSGYSKASMAANTGWLSSSLQREGAGLTGVLTRLLRACAWTPMCTPPRVAGAPGSPVCSPCDAREVDQHVFEQRPHDLVGGLAHLGRCERDLHLLQAWQQLIVLQHGKAVLRHGCKPT